MITTVPVPHNIPRVANGENGVLNVQNGAFVQTNDERPAAQDGGQTRYQFSTLKEIRTSTSTSTITNRMLSRPASPNHEGPAKKKSSSSEASKGPTMMKLHTSKLGRVFGSLHGQPQFGNGFQTPDSSDQVPLLSERSASTDNLAMIETHSVPTSSYPSRAMSPHGLSNRFANGAQNPVTPHLFANHSFSLDVNQTQALPVIHKIIPNEGPKFGGIEVTLLGAGFSQGLEAWFGEQKATTTTYWGDSSLVCLLPSSPVAGNVVVTFKDQWVLESNHVLLNSRLATFKYIDDNESMVIRTALSVLGRIMSGHIDDVIDLARRILNDGN
ncbi:Immunoglobulin E-set, partial [Metarhizium majus ARSEF 297]